MRLLNEYKAMIKGLYVEEVMDLVLYRPISFVLVKMVYPFPVTPNQLSFLAMATGTAAGLLFGLGSIESFFIGGLLLALTNVIDCSDGMLARLKKNGTLTGRILDGFVDYVVSIALYVGLAVGLSHAVETGLIELPFNPYLICGIAGASNILSSGITDHFRNRYLTYVYGKEIIAAVELESFRREFKKIRAQRGRYLDKFLMWVYIVYTQAQLVGDAKPVVRYDAEEYKKYNRTLLLLWNLIGPTTHITVMVISALLFQPMIFFAYGILFANAWIVIMYPVQWWANGRLTPLAE
jgi:hypothetical protein